MSPFELRGNLQQQKAVHEVKDMVDLQGPFFFPVKLSIMTLTIVSKKKIGKILKHAQVIYTKVFLNGPRWRTICNMSLHKWLPDGFLWHLTSWSLNFNCITSLNFGCTWRSLKLECEWRKIKRRRVHGWK